MKDSRAVTKWLLERLRIDAGLAGLGAEAVMLGLYAAMSSRLGLLTVAVTQIPMGWLIARTSRAHPIPSLLASLTFGLTWWIYGKFSLINLIWWAYRNVSLSTVFIAAVSLFLGVLLSRSLRLAAAGERAGN